MAHKSSPSMLPPKPVGKREFAVNVRFSKSEREALQQIAAYRETTITELVHHVISTIALPQMLEEMRREQQPIKPDEPDQIVESKPPPGQLSLTMSQSPVLPARSES